MPSTCKLCVYNIRFIRKGHAKQGVTKNRTLYEICKIYNFYQYMFW